MARRPEIEEKKDEAAEEEPVRGRAGIRSSYYGLLRKIKPRPVKVTISTRDAKTDMSQITEIPRITEPNIDEVEILPVKKNYSYVRIRYDNIANEYTYEVIEPKLTDDESDLLELLKETLVASVERMTEEEEGGREKYLRRMTEELMAKLNITLHPISKERVMYYILRDFMGYRVIDAMMIEPNVEDLSCDGVGVPLYVYHRKYGSIRSTLRFDNEEELDGFVVWLAQRCGKHISVASPLLDATIPDGSRLQATLGKHVTKRGSSFTIRRFKENPFTPLDLLKFKTMSTEMMAYLWIGIEHGQSMLVCGGTASGKTTTLNAVLLFIPPQMKIVSIEDTRELNLPHENWVPGLTREGFGGKSAVTGRASGEIDMFDLLTAA
ncbi:MAG: type II/IV secretion system ATPase subunit, partial [Methanobacteriota archaeon]